MPKVYVHLYKLGLVLPEYVEPFLAGEGPGWRPLEVATGAGTRRWHLWRIWRAYMWEEIGEDAAADAVMQLPPEDLLRAITHDHRGALTTLTGLASEEAHYDRELRLLVAVVRRLIARGFDVKKAADELADDPSRNPTGIATVLLAACTIQGGEIAASRDPLLVKGLRRASSKALLKELLACVPDERRQRILEQVEKP